MHSFKKVTSKKYCIQTVRQEAGEVLSPTLESESNIDEWKHKWPDGTVTWKIERHSNDFERTYSLQRIFALAFLTWGKEMKNIKFKRLRKETADADIPITFLTSDEDKLFKERPGVLAYAYFPTPNSPVGGDMVFNEDYYWTWNGAGVNAHLVDPKNYPDPNTKVKLKTYNIQHTGVHELGHALGLRHNQSCTDCVMYPYYNGNVRLDSSDIARIQDFYGKRNLPSWLLDILRLKIKRGFSR
jgi:hypothetical protein